MPRRATTSEDLAITLVFVVIAVLACLAPAQGDTWWLLRAGQDIWTTWRVPLTEAYSHTAAGSYWPNHEWLTEATFYGLHRVGGMPLIAFACAVAATGAWLLAYGLTRGSFELRLVVLLACIAPAASSFALRPQMFTMLFFGSACYFLATDRLRWMPGLILIWANFHGAVALGLVAMAASAGAALLVDRRWPWAHFWTSLACIAATLLTPLGWRLWLFWLESPARSEVNQLIEWRPPGFSVELVPFWILAAAVPVAVLLKWARADRRSMTLAFIAIGVLPLAIQAVRNVPIFMLAALPAVTSLAAVGTTGKRSIPRGEHVRLNRALATAAMAGALIVVGLVWSRPPAMLGWQPLSPTVADAIRACRGPLLNTYEDGGAISWFVPSRPVFVDNRQDPYPMDLLDASRRAELEGDYRPLLARYPSRCAALPAGSRLASALGQDRQWQRVLVDADWEVFEYVPDQ